jgi:hypothetical protein
VAGSAFHLYLAVRLAWDLRKLLVQTLDELLSVDNALGLNLVDVCLEHGLKGSA